MIRALLLLPACLLLASCQAPQVVVHAAFVEGALAFVAADPDDSDVRLCWKEAAVVDDRAEAAWAIASPGLGECGPVLPIVYGRTPPGASAEVAPRPLEPGRLYLFVGGGSDGALRGAFTLSRSGRRTSVSNLDPDSPEAAALRERWWSRPRSEGRAGR